MSNWEYTIPRANPFRFKPTSYNIIDFDSVMPQFDLMSLNQDYQKGETHIEAYPGWLIGHSISSQFSAITYSGILHARIYKVGGNYNQVTPTNITPTGWTGYNVYKFNFTPTTTGFYYLTFTIRQKSPANPAVFINVTFKSDTFYVTDNLSTDKDLIELKYKNSENDFDMVFDDYYTAYYTAIYDESDGELNESFFQVDSGITKQKSDYYPGIDITFCEMKKRYKQTLINQLRCDSLLFNGVECLSNSSINSAKIDNSDLVNITTSLTLKSDNNSLHLY